MSICIKLSVESSQCIPALSNLESKNAKESAAEVKELLAEHTEMYWYLVELFTESDTNKDGIITLRAFPSMVDKVLQTPKKLAVKHPEKVSFGFTTCVFNLALFPGDV